ncbi:MAG TPA: serine--tRNA ligase, partial [Syntrophorhabdaceae bacterium]|nr:serine--tRNA ligase [Syntrophorhabdaceae bacterium]
MIDPKLIRENIGLVKESLGKRSASFDIERLMGVEEKRRRLIQETEKMKSEKNLLSGEIAKLKKAGSNPVEKIEHLRTVGKNIEEMELSLKATEKEWEDMILVIPNIPHDTVPVGAGDEDNQVVRFSGEKPHFDFDPLAHWDIGEKLDILDFKRAAKITGSRFTLYKGYGALL